MKTALRGLALLLALGLGTTASADDDFWLGAKAGTLGLGLEATWKPSRFFDLRVGGNTFSYDDTATEAGIDYDTELDLRSYYATANLRFPLSPFRFTAGAVSNGNEVNLRSRSTSNFDIGGTSYTAAQVGQLSGSAGFDSLAPYAGIGFDLRLLDTLGLSIDLGVLMQGSADLSLGASGPIASDPTFQSQLEAERRELQDELDDYDMYPVLSLGLSWNF